MRRPAFTRLGSFLHQRGIPYLVPPARNVNADPFVHQVLPALRPDFALSLICLQVFRATLLAGFQRAINYHPGTPKSQAQPDAIDNLLQRSARNFRSQREVLMNIPKKVEERWLQIYFWSTLGPGSPEATRCAPLICDPRSNNGTASRGEGRYPRGITRVSRLFSSPECWISQQALRDLSSQHASSTTEKKRCISGYAAPTPTNLWSTKIES